MTYRIENIELFVRDTPPGRMAFSLGKQGGTGAARQGLTNPLGHVRMVLRGPSGTETFGCAADRLSVRWLDKRAGRSLDLKRRELAALISSAREIYLAEPVFATPFEKWHACHDQVMRVGRSQGQEDLTSSFASALMERALVDGVCRLERTSVFQMIKQDRLGFQPSRLHPNLGNLRFPDVIAEQPRTEFFIRHTVGTSDPLTAADLSPAQQVDDGLPETLEDYIRTDGVRFFKVKISGDVEADLERLSNLWDVVLKAETPAITLDANEAYADLSLFSEFVRRFQRDLAGLFQHTLYIEQPLPRHLPIDRHTETALRGIAENKPLLIDEADGTLDAFSKALAVGYQGTSHKNCKGFFKSLANHALAADRSEQGTDAFLSAEDLQNLPIVPLHQDFATLGILGLEHCERNGHHYNYGLALLSDTDKRNAVRHHSDLYVRRGVEWFLNVHEGRVNCDSLQCPGFGVHDEPDWKSMTDMQTWIKQNHPA